MDITLILSAGALVLTLQIAILVQVFRISEKVSKLCGQYETHLKGCNTRFQSIEERLDKANL